MSVTLIQFGFLILLAFLSGFGLVMISRLFNEQKLSEQRQIERLNDLKQALIAHISTHKEDSSKHFFDNFKMLQDTLRSSLNDITDRLVKQFDKLSDTTEHRLKDISGVVEKRLNEGFEKTTQTFTDIIKRLALIDDAQKQLTDLSSNVVSLQEILIDKRSRGAFGEIQLNHLIKNSLPEKHYAFQHSLSNGMRADCALFLPDPIGTLIIDSKFPLENYQRMTQFEAPESDKKAARQQFKQDIKKHITDISSKYILPGETAEGALLFLPAEAIFAEIHNTCPDLVEFAHRHHVWLVSPTTMMAIITTVSAVLKDDARKEHIHVIQEHLRMLAKDFSRFESRMTKLAKHIDQAQEDVKQVHTSAQKISKRFSMIEQGQLGEPPTSGAERELELSDS